MNGIDPYRQREHREGAGMFDGLAYLSLKRTANQAVGFYIAYLLLGLLIAGILAALVSLITTGFGSGGPRSYDQQFAVGFKVGSLTAIPYTLILGTMVVFKKKISFGYYLLVIFSPLLAVFGGMLVGLIPVAFITTKALTVDENNRHWGRGLELIRK